MQQSNVKNQSSIQRGVACTYSCILISCMNRLGFFCENCHKKVAQIFDDFLGYCMKQVKITVATLWATFCGNGVHFSLTLSMCMKYCFRFPGFKASM